MRALVDELCSARCAGRRSGSPGGVAAREIVLRAFRGAGLDPYEHPVPRCGGANVLAMVPGTTDRWIVVAAHYDHLGQQGTSTYWGADDNAAAVAILADVARATASRRDGRGVIFAAFDGEEPPFFLTGAMGSQEFVRAPPVPRDRIDFMVCMDLVGHRLGPSHLPDDVGHSLFALGGERSRGTAQLVRTRARVEPGVIVRPVDAEIIPPLSDYEPFWRAEIPFLFLTAGRSAVYHTPDDTPEKLDFAKMDATARWLSRFVRDAREREDECVFSPGATDDAGSLREILEVVIALRSVSPEAAMAEEYANALLAACDSDGALPSGRREELGQLVELIESRLA